MPKDFPRSRRVADQIQRELAEVIRLELKDPRVSLVTITDVVVTSDLEQAKIYVTSLSPTVEHAAVLAGLQRAAGFLRSQLSRRMKLRIVPALSFDYDTSVERGMKLSQLIDQAIAEDSTHPKDE
jgi:ribosome-binding factor A